jgi:hypothetical protein
VVDGAERRKLDEIKDDTCADHAKYATFSVDEKFELLARIYETSSMPASGDEATYCSSKLPSSAWRFAN